MTLPLEGIRVLEIAEVVFGPATVSILGDWGADVVKIEHPVTGDRMRGIQRVGVLPVADINFGWHQLNRGKRSVGVDLNAPRGIAIVHKLIQQSDVFVTNFLPGARRRIGIEYEDLAAVNPRLVYARVSGYGPRGAEWEKGGYDYAAFWARNGLAMTLGNPGDPPVCSRPGLGDNTSALSAAGAIAAALFRRERTGEGALIDVSLMGCGIWVNSLDILAAHYTQSPVPRLAHHEMGNPLWNCYQGSDGRWLQLVMLQTDPYWRGFCRALARPELETDERFATHDLRVANNRLLIEVLDEVFGTRTIAEWGERLEGEGCLWSQVQEASEVVGDPQAIANGYITSTGDLKLVASPAQFDLRPNAVAGPAPDCGQHTEEVLLEIGYTWEELAELKDLGTIL